MRCPDSPSEPSVPPDDAVPLVELTGQVLGVPVRVGVLEPPDCDTHAVYAAILDGRYDKPFVVDDGTTRQLLFSLDFIQSSMRLDDPCALDFAYTRKMMACLLFVPTPEHLLMVGLGGGSLAKFCHRHLPQTRITVLEIDPDVIALGRAFAGPESAWAAHRILLELEFEQVLMLATADADNHVAFAFTREVEADEWTRLKQPATALARRVPLDFPLPLKRLRRIATRKKSFIVEFTVIFHQPKLVSSLSQ